MAKLESALSQGVDEGTHGTIGGMTHMGTRTMRIVGGLHENGYRA